RIGLSMRGLFRVVALFVFVSSSALAQEAAPPAAPSPTPTATPAPAAPADAAAKKAPVAAVDKDFTLGLAYHGPTRITGSATLIWCHPRMLVAWGPAKLVQARVGAGGAQLSLGFVAGVFEESAWKPSGIAITLKAVGLKTWREKDGLPSRSYAGAESDIVI